MPSRTPSKWPYRGQRATRTRRVVKVGDAGRGVHRRETAAAAPPISPAQARLMLALLLLGAIVAAAYWAYQSPYMTVHEISVEGATQLSETHVREVAGIDGKSTFRVDVDAAEARLLALPQVRSASIERHGWTGATITIEERVPWGSWQINGVNVPIDIDGHVLDGVTAAEGSPVIVEVEPQRAIRAGDRLDPGAIQLAARLVEEADRTLGRRVVALAYRQNAGLTAILTGTDIDSAPVWVTFGDSRDYDYKVTALYVLLEQAHDANITVSAVDLRFGGRISFN